MELLCQRLARYRCLADRAHRSAMEAGTAEVRVAFFAVAKNWDSMADELEHLVSAIPSFAAKAEAEAQHTSD